MEKPRTQFTKAGRVSIAYQVVGDGPVDLVYASGWLHNIDVIWENPGYRAFLEGLTRFARLILFDKRGTGMSDRDVGAPTLEERAEDIRAVMDAAGSERATVFGVSEGGNMTTMFAATYPERVQGIVLIACFPCRAWKPDWPSGMRRAEFEKFLEELENEWGDLQSFLSKRGPSIADIPEEREFLNRLFTQSASPPSALAITRLNYEIDIRPILPAIQAPALVIHRRGDLTVTSEEATYLSDNLPNGRLVVVEGDDHLPWVGDRDEILREIRQFATGSAESAAVSDRILLSVLMTDLAGSTERAAEIGDAAWHRLLEAHDQAAAAAIARHGGQLVKTTGDGVLATFAGPSRAILAARDMRGAVSALGLEARAGVHIGECLRRGADVSGLAINIAARIMNAAPGGEIWVSGTVRDLVVGAGLGFEALGPRPLKGVPGAWPLHRLVA